MSNINESYLVTVSKSATLQSASSKMQEEGIHHLVVVDQNEIVGLMSDRDILDAWVRSGGGDLTKLTVADAYRSDIPTVTPETSVQEAVVTMQREFSDALLVKGDHGVAVMSTMDLLRSLTSKSRPSGIDFAKLTFADPLLQKIMKTLSDIGI